MRLPSPCLGDLRFYDKAGHVTYGMGVGQEGGNSSQALDLTLN